MPAADASASPPVDLEVSVLGPPTVRVDGRAREFPAGRPGRLLGALVVARGRVVSRDALVDAVWGDDPPEDARAALHTTVRRLRRALGAAGALLEHRSPGYRLVREGVVLDSDAFEAAAAEARRTGRVGDFDRALMLWGGPAWGSLADDVARGEALRLEELHRTVREERAAALLEGGEVDRAVGALRVLVAEDPVRERPVGLLMRALHASGDVAGALAAYDDLRTRLADELGLDPSPALAALHGEVLRRTVDVPAAQESALRTAAAAGADVPAVGPLYGREAHLASVQAMLGTGRCVTVVGPGGVGKTSLAAVVGGTTEGEVWWVDLTRLSDPDLVRNAVAAAMDVRVHPGGSLDAALDRRLEGAHGLLVLDNCEHVLGAAGELVERALLRGGGIRVLATSRERLGVPEEKAFPLPPLQLPPPAGEHLEEIPAVALFLARAEAAVPDLPTDPATVARVAQLVRSLDGLPLAIELAAGRLGSVTLDDLESALEGRLELLGSSRSGRRQSRHRTLTSTIEWSHDLLTERERAVFAGLSVFAGPFDLAAADAVLGPGAASVVADLVERSLVVGPGRTGRGRYRLLETLRAFARGRLDPDEADRLRRSHARWVRDLAQRAADGLRGPEEGRWAAEVREAMPDVAAARAWAVAAAEHAWLADVVEALEPWAYYHLRPTVLGWARALVDEPEGRRPGVYAAAAAYCWMTGDHVDGLAYATAGVAVEGEPLGRARCHGALGDLCLAIGETDEAEREYDRATVIAEECGVAADTALHAVGVLLARVYAGRPHEAALRRARELAGRTETPSSRAFCAYAEGEAAAGTDPDAALEHLSRAIALADTVDNALVRGVATTALAAIAARAGRLDERTREQVAASVRYWSGSGNDSLYVTCLRNVVPLLARLGRHQAVVELAATLATVAPDRPSYGAEGARLDGCLAAARDALGDGYDAAWRAGQPRSLAEAGALVLAELG